jgi:hypothetical protein
MALKPVNNWIEVEQKKKRKNYIGIDGGTVERMQQPPRIQVKKTNLHRSHYRKASHPPDRQERKEDDARGFSRHTAPSRNQAGQKKNRIRYLQKLPPLLKRIKKGGSCVPTFTGVSYVNVLMTRWLARSKVRTQQSLLLAITTSAAEPKSKRKKKRKSE